MNNRYKDKQHVVIVGGGFGGMYAAKSLARANVQVTLIDRRNFHLFQPLLYQVATGGLSPGDIAYPLRTIFNHDDNIQVIHAEVIDIDPLQKKVILRDGEVAYDTLILATGSTDHYYGNAHWAEKAPSLKSVEDALDIRRRIFLAFEAAERTIDENERRAWLDFVVVGAGPTGVELSGAIAELAHRTLRKDFKNIDTASANIYLIEGLDRVLPTYPKSLSVKTKRELEKRGVQIKTGTLVTNIQDGMVSMKSGEQRDIITTNTVLWAAGVKASDMGKIVERRIGIATDKSGRIPVTEYLQLPTHPDIYVIGDLALVKDKHGNPLVGLGAVAMQQGRYVGRSIKKHVQGKHVSQYRFHDRGKMAFIGLNSAVVDIGPLHFNGFFGWLFWLFVHIYFLIGFDNKILVMTQWAWNYFTHKRGARLITGKDPFPVLLMSTNSAKALQTQIDNSKNNIREFEHENSS
ncbi:NAD(P)/FAD-dependent oxidoreductase [candidate division KSB1 bacterium]|nr:NAD(P)/FAD-dependent oxidoreductase [candidate division KSB1 bacterium]